MKYFISGMTEADTWGVVLDVTLHFTHFLHPFHPLTPPDISSVPQDILPDTRHQAAWLLMPHHHHPSRLVASLYLKACVSVLGLNAWVHTGEQNNDAIWLHSSFKNSLSHQIWYSEQLEIFFWVVCCVCRRGCCEKVVRGLKQNPQITLL